MGNGRDFRFVALRFCVLRGKRSRNAFDHDIPGAAVLLFILPPVKTQATPYLVSCPLSVSSE